MHWPSVTSLVAVLAPLVAAPMGLVVLYLKAVHDGLTQRSHELSRQLERCSERLMRLGDELSAVQRNYTTKEEWLRESLLTRQTLEQIRQTLVRLQRE
jgi:hypothetical protein